MKRSIGIALAAAAALAIGLAQTPAHAGGPIPEKYYVVNSLNGDNLMDWYWIDELEGIIGCPKCGWLIDLFKSKQLSPAEEKRFQSGVAGGLAKLSAAKVADPRTAARLRAEAVSSFASAARALGDASVRPGLVGYFDPDRGENVTAYRDWLHAADQDLADGLSLLQRSFAGPEPDPWVERALEQFLEAYEEIATKRAIG